MWNVRPFWWCFCMRKKIPRFVNWIQWNRQFQCGCEEGKLEANWTNEGNQIGVNLQKVDPTAWRLAWISQGDLINPAGWGILANSVCPHFAQNFFEVRSQFWECCFLLALLWSRPSLLSNFGDDGEPRCCHISLLWSRPSLLSNFRDGGDPRCC